MVSNKMIMELYVAFPSALTATFYLIALIFLYKTFKQKKAKTGNNKNPPQPKGAWPIIGHLHLLESDLSHRVLGNMFETCGPIFTIKLGFHKALVVSDAEIAKECFTTKDKVFATRPKSLAVEILAYNYATFGLGPYGDYWRNVRKLVMVELLSQRRVDSLRYIRLPEVKASMKYIFEAWLSNKERTDSDMVHVEMKELFGNLVLTMVSRTISGKRFLRNDEETVRVHAVIRKFLELLGTFMVSDFIPCVKFLDLGGYQKAMKTSAKEMDNILEGWLKDHKKRRERVGHHEGELDFMDVLISVLERDNSFENFPDFDHDTIIKSTTLAMFTAGVDTTVVTLIWALALLLNNPDALKAAQDELDVHIGRERLVQESDINNLVYLQAIIKETLRLYPAAPISVPRESTDTCIVAGYSIPKGTRLILNLWKLHRDPNIWSDPNKFRPERFLTSHKDIDVKGQHYELLPFGSGRRMCPGVSFALQSMHLTLASLIQAFELLKPSKEPIDMSESLGLTNMKASPLEVLLRPRLPINMYHYDI